MLLLVKVVVTKKAKCDSKYVRTIVFVKIRFLLETKAIFKLLIRNLIFRLSPIPKLICFLQKKNTLPKNKTSYFSIEHFHKKLLFCLAQRKSRFQAIDIIQFFPCKSFKTIFCTAFSAHVSVGSRI